MTDSGGNRLAEAARRYAKTGSFNRLAGRSTAPGSEFPPHYFLKRRVIWVLAALALLAPGLIALFF